MDSRYFYLGFKKSGTTRQEKHNSFIVMGSSQKYYNVEDLGVVSGEKWSFVETANKNKKDLDKSKSEKF